MTGTAIVALLLLSAFLIMLGIPLGKKLFAITIALALLASFLGGQGISSLARGLGEGLGIILGIAIVIVGAKPLLRALWRVGVEAVRRRREGDKARAGQRSIRQPTLAPPPSARRNPRPKFQQRSVEEREFDDDSSPWIGR
jgi:hypothetical protein